MVPPIELAPDEAVPFRAGYRMAPAATERYGFDPIPMDYLTLRMTPAERRHLLASSDQHWQMWAMVGIMQWHIEASMRACRAG